MLRIGGCLVRPLFNTLCLGIYYYNILVSNSAAAFRAVFALPFLYQVIRRKTPIISKTTNVFEIILTTSFEVVTGQHFRKTLILFTLLSVVVFKVVHFFECQHTYYYSFLSSYTET